MKKNAYLKQHKTNSWEEEDVKRGRKFAAEGKMGHAEALFDDAHGSWGWRGGNDGVEQKIDGDMGSFDVMSEPVKMSVSANKVNRHSAGRSNFMQAKEEEKPKTFKVVDRQATNAANMEITKDNQAISSSNTANKAEMNRINAAAAIDFQKNKAAAEAEAKRQAERNRIEKARVDIENAKGNLIRQQDPQLSKRKRKREEKKAQKKTSRRKNPFSGI